MRSPEPGHEPLKVTLARNFGIALVAGGVLASRWGGIARWPLATAVMLWPSLGGHWLEMWFLNLVRPRFSDNRTAQVVTRIAMWFAGGAAIVYCMWLSATTMSGLRSNPLLPWWGAGLAFIGIELVAHAILQLRGRPSFFNGRG